jgi:two-component system response regulator AtoC
MVQTANQANEMKSLGEAFGYVAGVSPVMLAIEGMMADIAPTSFPVLILGESGTGKQMVAHRVHHLSLHGGEPLVKIACASMTPQTLSAELRLSAYGERTRRPGTVFFDEISELDTECQRLLLHALPDGESVPQSGKIMARLISTTSRNLDIDVREGRFRSDLYYRLNGACLRLPPLRKRREDILPLAEFLLTKHSDLLGRSRPTLSGKALRIFLDYSWPGNIRELENVIKNIVAVGEEEIAIAAIATASNERRISPNTTSNGNSLKAAARAASRETERELILRTLARTRWNRKRAAEELQISYKSFLYKLKQIGLPDSESN